jgi:DNA processing protein
MNFPEALLALSPLRRFIYRHRFHLQSKTESQLVELISHFLPKEDFTAYLSQAENIDRINRETEVRVLSFYDPRYPNLLREIYDPPLVLFCIGDIDLLAGEFVGVVGTRKAAPVSLFATQKLVEYLARDTRSLTRGGFPERRLGVVSGMALGVDSIATETSIEEGLPTIGVLGTPVTQEYPQANKNLYKKMRLSPNCILISELLPEISYSKWTFPMRNRIITGISKKLYLMETPAKSGAMSSAKNALEQNRDLVFFSHPMQFNNEGAESFISEGAEVIRLKDLGLNGEVVHGTRSLIQKADSGSLDPGLRGYLQSAVQFRESKAIGIGGGFYYLPSSHEV